jgi:hypothetical protein
MTSPAERAPGDRMTDFRHIPYDELTQDERCAEPRPHEDHYWRTDGKPTPAIEDHPAERYCDGMRGE